MRSFLAAYQFKRSLVAFKALAAPLFDLMASFLAIWQRGGSLEYFYLALTRRFYGAKGTIGLIPTSHLWPQLESLNVRLLFFCTIRYARLNRKLRKILKNRYRYSKCIFYIRPTRRWAFTLHFTKLFLKVNEGGSQLARLASFFKADSSESWGALRLARDQHQLQALSALITKNLGKAKRHR